MAAKQTPESFWARVHKNRNSCWEWQGTCNSTGYGTVAWHGRVYTTHRVAAWLSGLISTPAAPKNRKGAGFVLHKCDNRKCCNPKHFTIGTYADNQRDAYNKHRRAQPKGQNHTNAKLTNYQAAAIREAYRKGQTQMKLAAIYGVSQAAVSKIILRKTY